MKPSTRSLMLVSLLVGVALGFALAKLVVVTAASVAVALIIVALVVVAYYAIRRRMGARRDRRERGA